MKYSMFVGGLVCILVTGVAAEINVIDTIDIGPAAGSGFSPDFLAVDTSTNRVYVLTTDPTYAFNAVSVIDAATDSVLSLIPLDTEADELARRRIAINPNTNRVYVASDHHVSVIDGVADTVVSTLTLGCVGLSGVATNPATNLVYVTSYSYKDSLTCILYVIDGATNSVVDSIAIPLASEICVNPGANQMYLNCPCDSQVIVMDLVSNVVIDAIMVGSMPMQIAGNWQSGRVYVSTWRPASTAAIVVIDAATNLVIDTVAINSTTIAVDPNADRLYVIDHWGQLVVVDGPTGSILSTVELNGDSYGIVAVNPQTGRVYVTSGDLNAVSVVDGVTNTLIDRVVVGRYPHDIALDTLSEQAYVTSETPGDVAVIDLTSGSLVGIISLGDYYPQVQVYDVVLNSATNRLYVQRKSQDGDSILVLDLSTGLLLASVFVGDTPYSPRVIAVNLSTNRVYVATTDGIRVIDGVTNSLIGTIPISDPLGAHCVTVNPSNNCIYAAGRYSKAVFVIDGATDSLIQYIPMEDSPSDIAINSNTNHMYVSGWAEGTGGKVSVIDCSTHSLVATIKQWWWARPYAIAANQSNNRIYVWQHEAMYVIDGATNVIVDSVTLIGGSVRFCPLSCEVIENRLYTPAFEPGVVVLEDDMAVHESPEPMQTTRLEVHPNPSGGSVFIKFTLGVRGLTSLKIYDTAGRLVKILAEGVIKDACYSVTWHGEDDSGSRVAPGVYFCKLNVCGELMSRKVVVTK